MDINDVITYIEKELDVVEPELIEWDDNGIKFQGVLDGEAAEVELLYTNSVFINGEPRHDIYLPFNVWAVE